MRKFSKSRTVALTVAVDVLLIAVLILGFAYFHHVRMVPVTEKRVLATPVPTEAPTPEPTAEPTAEPVVQLSAASQETPEPAPTPTPTPEPVDTGILGGKYAEKFTSGEVINEEKLYRSANVAIEISEQPFEGSNCIVADIYLKDISSFKTAVFDQFGRYYMPTLDMANAAGAILALSGDHFYQHRQNGTFAIRNGVVYADNPNKRQDCCVLYSDGTMACIKNTDIDVAAIEAKSPLHVWYFGPLLLDENGFAIDKFTNTSVGNENPRSAIGYYEPGHYVFVMVEGRYKDSPGLTMVQLAKFFESLGCKCAYNLDGGQSSVITYNGKAISRLHNSGRDIADILYIVEPGA